MSELNRYGSRGSLGRNAAVVGSVVALHVAGLWALQAGLLRRAVEVIVPVAVLSEFVTPPAPLEPLIPPAPPAPPAPAPAPPRPTRQPRAPAPPPRLPAPPMPVAIADPAPAPSAPVGVIAPQPPAPPIGAPVASSAAPPAPPAPTAGAQSPGGARHFDNPEPPYPALSRRLGEEGTVLLNVLIGADGLPQKVEIKQSSGFERLDRQALNTVSHWRFAPRAEAAWYLQPVRFVLQQ